MTFMVLQDIGGGIWGFQLDNLAGIYTKAAESETCQIIFKEPVDGTKSFWAAITMTEMLDTIKRLVK